VITNSGTLCGHTLEFNVQGLLNCEFPPGSFQGYHGEGGIWIGAITPDNDTLVTTTISWSPGPLFWETYPSEEPWDTIWVVNKGDTVDIPYWTNYVGISDQDFVMRYNDYGPASRMDQRHTPLYLEYIQTVYSWSAPKGMSEILVHNYYFWPTKIDLHEVYIGFWLDPNVGITTQGTNFLDDYSLYYPDIHLAAGVDGPGGIDGTCSSPIGVIIIPPEDFPEEDLIWTWKWGSNPWAPGMIPPLDADKYRDLLSSGEIMENQQIPTGSHFVLAFGPFELSVGDTFHFTAAEIFGDGINGMLDNAKNLNILIDQDFKVPFPPPLPQIQVETGNHRIRLIWEPTNQTNPEIYKDPYRADDIDQPFEGYRVYKSTKSVNGPWTLLAEYDIPENGYGNDLGLEHEYIEELLLNNIEYYYSVTAFSKEDTVLNWPSLESSISANAKTVVPGTAPPQSVGEVAVVPNPYRGDIAYNEYNPPWEKPPPSRQRWMEQDRRIQFINLPTECEVKIYTLFGNLVETIVHSDPVRGYEDWNLTSSVGQAIASGIYIFSVEDKNTGKVQIGKFVVIK